MFTSFIGDSEMRHQWFQKDQLKTIRKVGEREQSIFILN